MAKSFFSESFSFKLIRLRRSHQITSIIKRNRVAWELRLKSTHEMIPRIETRAAWKEGKPRGNFNVNTPKQIPESGVLNIYPLFKVSFHEAPSIIINVVFLKIIFRFG